MSTRLDPNRPLENVWLCFRGSFPFSAYSSPPFWWCGSFSGGRIAPPSESVHRFGARVNRFKLTRKPYIRDTLLANHRVAEAARQYATEQGVSDADAWRRVRQYIDEIVPFFNILAYYKFGYAVSHATLNLLYKVSVDYEDLGALEALPPDAVVIYLANHRSNADYVLLAYVLAGDVSISYAVGEWARAFPLEYVFKSFGSYFIRRRYREPLYHTVLEQYVQLITRNGVTQGIFPEGGLTRDGHIRPGKVGLVDYMLGTARDPDFARRLTIIPVALNYDRVLEDRSLLRELVNRESGSRTSRLTQLGEVSRLCSVEPGTDRDGAVAPLRSRGGHDWPSGFGRQLARAGE